MKRLLSFGFYVSGLQYYPNVHEQITKMQFMKTLVGIITILILNLSCEDKSPITNVQNSSSSCVANISTQLILSGQGLAFNIDAKNIGDRIINNITVPFTLKFTDNSTASGQAYASAITLAPGEDKTFGALVNPASQNPYNPRYFDDGGKSLDKVEYSTPTFICNLQ